MTLRFSYSNYTNVSLQNLTLQSGKSYHKRKQTEDLVYWDFQDNLRSWKSSKKFKLKSLPRPLSRIFEFAYKKLLLLTSDNFLKNKKMTITWNIRRPLCVWWNSILLSPIRFYGATLASSAFESYQFWAFAYFSSFIVTT